MLKRQVDIFDDLRFGGNDLDQLVGGAVGVAVEKTHPADFFNFTELAQQLGQHELSVEVLPIAGGVLCDDVQLDHTPVGKAAGFFKDLFHRHAAEMPPNVRNCAEGAAVVTALSHLEVGKVRLIGQNPFSFERQIGFFPKGDHPLPLFKGTPQ